jgi:tetrathionate reductase subunit A
MSKLPQTPTPRTSFRLLTRRSFLQFSAVSMAALASATRQAEAARQWLNPRRVQKVAATPLDQDVRQVHSTCLGCNARCGTRTSVQGGKLVAMSGNPYHPYNTKFNPIPYATPLKDALETAAPVCGKAHDAPNYLYNPYRIVRPMKRSGKRGSGNFEPIEWDQMVREISAGGKLFAHLGEDRDFPGIKGLAKDTLIDKEAPELGSVRNGFVFIAGRDQSGRLEFTNRFVKEAVGSVNRVGHTDICGIGFRMGNLAFTEQKDVEIKADPVNAEYILLFGANIYEALQPGVNTYGALVANRSSSEKVKFTIVDPRATNASCHADEWVAVKPGQDGAFAMGLIRYIIENGRHNREFLSAPHPKAAEKIGHACYCNSTHLVIVDETHPHNRKFLRVADLDPAATGEAGQRFLVLNGEHAPVPFDSVDTAELDGAAVVTDAAGRKIKVQTSFSLMKEGVWEHGLDDYARMAGVERSQMERVAKEFTSHGTRAAVCQYHGAGNYASGVYAAFPIAILNALIGSVDRKGGYVRGGGGAAGWDTGLYDLKSFAGQVKAKGVMLSREKSSYESSSEFKKKKAAGGSGYPAKRPWYPFTQGGLCVETLSGIDQSYPYSCKILFSYFFNPLYSIPGGRRFAETLESPEKVPLHVSIDIGINESNLYADYLVPDITYLEGHYGFLTPHAPALKFTAIRTPAVEPVTGKTGDGRSFSLESFLIDLAKEAGLPGFGDGAIKGKDGALHPLHSAEDYYLRGIANLAAAAKIPEAAAEEVAFVEHNYPVARHKGLMSGKEWRTACYALARGGIFNRRYEDDFDGENHRFGLKRVVLYNEELATTRNSLTGAYFAGTLKYLAPEDAAGNVIAEKDSEFPFALITFKMNLHAQSRSTSHRWSMEVFPENFVIINEKHGVELGVQDGDLVRLTSSSNPQGVKGKVKLSALIRPGCVGVSFHYGHTQMGASSLPVKKGETLFLGGKEVVDGKGMIGDRRLGTGISPNLLSRLDGNLGHTPLVDVIGGIPDFSSTRVNIRKVG